VQHLEDTLVTDPNVQITLECITRTPRSVNPYTVRWFHNSREITPANAPHLTMFNYNNDDKQDGSVLNFNKLVLKGPLSQAEDAGEYTVRIDDDLTSSANLVFISQKTASDEGLVYRETVTYIMDNTNSLSTITENEKRVTNALGSNSQTKLDNESEQLAFVKQLESFYECAEGGDLLLECVVNKQDTFSEWFKNGEPLLGATSGKMDILNLDGKKHRLIIKRLCPSDSGAYACKVNALLQTSTVINVSEDLPLKIVRGLHDMHLPECESNVQLCVEMNKPVRVDNNARTVIKWLVNKNELKPSNSDMQTCVLDNKLFLKFLRDIQYATDNDSLIECRIQEFKTGLHNIELSTKCRLIVEQRTVNRFFTKKLDDFVQADSGLNLDLETRVNFDAQLVSWFKNNAQILPNAATAATYTFLNDPANKSFMLRIKTCRAKDTGIYKVDVDGLQCSGEVKIVDTPIAFVQPLTDQFYDLEQDSSITLDCQLNKPPGMLGLKPRWFKNDLEIASRGTTAQQQNKYEIIEEHSICALVIYDLDERDEGRYRCQVGGERTECLVRPEYTLTKYLPNSVDVREGEAVTLSFALNRPANSLYSTPAVTKWFKDGQEIAIAVDLSKFVLGEHGNERSLTIKNCRLTDSGLYKAYMVDENNSRVVSSAPPVPLVTTNSCQVEIKKLKVDFVTPLERRVTGGVDETVKLYCETVQENLKPKWFFNEIQIETGSTTIRNNNKEFYSTSTQHLLVINDAQQSDSGTYKLKFSSDYEFVTEVLINQPGDYSLQSQPLSSNKKKTEVSKGLADVQSTEGETITLVCEFDRELHSNHLVEWKKNGETIRPSPNIEFVCEANKCLLIVTRCSKADAGAYELSLVELNATTADNVTKTRCQVHVTSYVDKAEVVKQLPRMLKFNEGDTLRLECTLDKKPESVAWSRNSTQIAAEQDAVRKSKCEMFALDEGKIQVS
jgi:hypothetical protein